MRIPSRNAFLSSAKFDWTACLTASQATVKTRVDPATDRTINVKESTMTISNSESVVDQWRNSADAENPAGPLYLGGEFAESDIAADQGKRTLILVCQSGHRCGSVRCTPACG